MGCPGAHGVGEARQWARQLQGDAYVFERWDRRRAAKAAVALFALIFVLIGWDVAQDYQEGVGPLHLLVEATVLLAAASGMAMLWRQLATTHSGLAAARAEADAWRRESEALVQGLRAAIEGQLARWQVTPAEAEVALLLLKGLSLREVAAARGTSERTAREQARAIYRKSGLANRSELAAFFLEDLLPGADAPPRPAPES